MNNIIFRNIRIVDCSTDRVGDLFVENGVIASLPPARAKIVDGSGLVVMPSFVDLHVHFREPGLTYKEDIVSGAKAAVAGGYTKVVMMGNTKPVCSSLAIMRDNERKAAETGLVDGIQCLSITRNFDGYDLSHLEELSATSGCRVISDDGYGVEDQEVMRKALLLAKKNGWVLSSHAEYRQLAQVDSRAAENKMTARDIVLAGETEGHLHMAHVSTVEAMEMIAGAKDKNAHVSCEVAPHHLALTAESCTYRVNPPLRDNCDREALIKAIKKGYVDAIATDHAPHTAQDKENGAPGMVGLETAFMVCYSVLVKSGEISLGQLSALMSRNGANIIGSSHGRLESGRKADLVLADLLAKQKVDAEKFYSKGRNTPFAGREYFGRIIATYKKGRAVYSCFE